MHYLGAILSIFAAKAVVGPATAFTGVAVKWAGAISAVRPSRRKIEQRRLKRRIEAALVAGGAKLAKLRPLGNGNTGSVYICRHDEEFLGRMGLIWRSRAAWPEQVALKLGSFRDAEAQAALLSRVAARIEEAQEGGEQSPQLCPYLGIGVFTAQGSGEAYVVEIMPHIEGEPLRKVLLRRALCADSALPQLLAVLRTVVFLESHGYYSRSVDSDNIIVAPDGRWTRIDFDRLEEVTYFPVSRTRRLSEVVLRVLKCLPRVSRTPEGADLRRRLRATLRRDMKTNPMSFVSPEPLIEKLEQLAHAHAG